MANLSTGKDSTTTMRSFISNFVEDKFFSDIISVSLYPAEFNLMSMNSGNNSAIEYIKKFFQDLIKTCDRIKIQNIKQIKNNAHTTSAILTIRESGSSIINYDNVFNHMINLDVAQQKLIQGAIQSRITDASVFRRLTNSIINSIQAYYEICSISSGIIMFDQFSEQATKSDISVFEAIKQYKDNVILLYNDLSNLQIINKYESEKDYFVINDKESTKSLAETLVNFISTGYSFLKTGFDLFDSNIEGFESSSVHLISAPSNHGKSLFMVNLAHTIIKENINDFEPTDCILFITLEDAMQKLVRRFCSVFGNMRAETMKTLYRRSYEALKANSLYGTDNNLEKNITQMFQSILNNSIQKVTNGKVSLVVKHAQENTYSPGDVSKFIDRLKIEGYNTKMVFLDYVDTMCPTVKRYSSFND